MFWDRFRTACELRKTAPTPAVRAVLKSTGMIDGWKKGSFPRSDVVAKLADHLDVSVDYLLERTDDPSPLSSDMRRLDEKEARLIDSLRTAPIATRDTAFRVALAALSTTAGHTSLSLAQNDDITNHAQPARARVRATKPVAGKAAAGVPITAVHEHDLHVTVPAKYLADRYFIVEAIGDSMIDANIESGDFCVFDSEAYQDNGSIVFAHVEGATEEEEVTIKRLYRRDGKIELRPANPNYPPMLFDEGCVRITGVLVRILSPDAHE